MPSATLLVPPQAVLVPSGNLLPDAKMVPPGTGALQASCHTHLPRLPEEMVLPEMVKVVEVVQELGWREKFVLVSIVLSGQIPRGGMP